MLEKGRRRALRQSYADSATTPLKKIPQVVAVDLLMTPAEVYVEQRTLE